MKHIYTLITPEGKEVVIGAFTEERYARTAAKRKFPLDWLGLCAYPLIQRPLREGEKVERWKAWTG